MVDPPQSQPEWPPITPASIRTRMDFRTALNALHDQSGLSLREVCRDTELSPQALHGYLSGKHLPRSTGRNIAPFIELLRVGYGIDDTVALDAWASALRRVAAQPGPRPDDETNPYPGLRPFQEEDSAWFFGRDDLIAEAVKTFRTASVSDNRSMIVTGPSGVGKSSLINAGIRATIHSAEEFSRWSVSPVVIGTEPVAALDAALARFPHDPQVLLVDQLETLWNETVDDDRRQEFLQRIAALASGDQSPPVFILMGLRADFYGQALHDPFLTRTARENQLTVGELDADQLRSVIVEPAQAEHADVEDELVELLLRDLAAESTLVTGALPLLATTLKQLWRTGSRRAMTAADYIASGGLSNVIRRTAEESWKELTSDEQRAAEVLLPRMVNVHDDLPPTRRRLSEDEVDACRRAHPDAFDDALGKLTASRMVVHDEHGVTLAHDALLRAWPELDQWVERDRKRLTTHAEIARSARRWDDNGRQPDYLYGTARLVAVTEALGPDPNLTPLESAFIRACRERADRRRLLRRALVAVLAVLLAASTGSLAVALDQHSIAVAETETAEFERLQAQSRMIASRSEQLRDSDPALAAQLAVAAFQTSPTVEARSALLSATSIPTATRMFANDAGIVQRVAVSPDGSLAAACGDDGRVWVWDIADPFHPVLLVDELPGTDGTVHSIQFGHDGRLYSAGGWDVLYLHDLSDAANPRLVASAEGPEGGINFVTVHPDSGRVAVGGQDSYLWVWDDPDLIEPPRRLETDGSLIKQVMFSHDGSLIGAANLGGTAVVHDLDGDADPVLLTTQVDRLFTLTFSHDGATLATGDTDGTVKLWALGAKPKLIDELTGPKNWLYSLAFLPDTPLLAAGASDGIWVWNTETDTEPLTVPSNGPVTDVVVHPDGSVYAGYADGSVKRWQLPGPVLTSPTGVVFDVEFLADGSTVAVAAGGDGIWLWDAADPASTVSAGPALRPPDAASWLVGAVAGSPDGALVAGAGRDGRIWLWDRDDLSAPREQTLDGLEDFAEQLMFSPDGARLAAVGTDGTVGVWDVAGDGEAAELVEVSPGSPIYTVRFSPDGGVIATAGLDQTVRLWSVRPSGLAPLGEPLTGPSQMVIWTTFNPLGTILAAGSADGHVYLWDVADPADPRPLPRLTGNGARIAGVDFSADGRLLAAASFDGGLLIWDVSDPERPSPYATLTGSNAGLRAVDFGGDGSVVAAAGDDPAARLWLVDPAAAASTVCEAAGAAVTAAEWHRHVPGVDYRPPC